MEIYFLSPRKEEFLFSRTFVFTIRNVKMRHLLWILTIVCARGSACAKVEQFHRSNEDDRVFDTVFESLYDGVGKYFRPNYTGNATHVAIDITIDSIGEINSLRKSVTLSMYLRQRWQDYRCKHDFPTDITPNLATYGHPAEHIWVPDTTLINMKSAKRHTKNDKLTLSPDGSVMWGTMLSTEIKCEMDFHDFPVDTQTCVFGFESYSYTAEHIKYDWHKDSITFVSKEVEQFVLKDYSISSSVEHYEAGDFSLLKIHLTFERQLEVTILQIFFPAVLVVCVSWVTLWMHKKSPSARVGLGTTTLLTLTMIWISANKKIPKVSYVKAIDTYFMISFCFILGVLFEYVIITNVNFAEWKTMHEERVLFKTMHKKDSKTNKNKRRRLYHGFMNGTAADSTRMKIFKETFGEDNDATTTTTSFVSRQSKKRLKNRHAEKVDAFKDIFRERTTYQEMIDEGFDLQEPTATTSSSKSNRRRTSQNQHNSGRDEVFNGAGNMETASERESSSGSDSESECSDDDGGCTKNSILLDKKIISMFLNTKPATLDIICRFMFPFCYFGFSIYWWLHYLEKRKEFKTDFCRDLGIMGFVEINNCQKHYLM